MEGDRGKGAYDHIINVNAFFSLSIETLEKIGTPVLPPGKSQFGAEVTECGTMLSLPYFMMFTW